MQLVIDIHLVATVGLVPHWRAAASTDYVTSVIGTFAGEFFTSSYTLRPRHDRRNFISRLIFFTRT